MRINELFGTKYPIIQGGMANISTGKFAAAVSNAGGLGIIASGSLTADELEQQIDECAANTNEIFGVNIMLMNPASKDIAELVVRKKIPVVTTGAGNPGPFIENWKKHGIKVMPVVPAVSLAKRMEKAGADAVIAEGTESGGHVGELTTMALVPQVAKAVSIPVVAAGGIASGQQMLAAFALGAVGVQVGTCLLVSEECPIHENYKNAIIKAKDTSTVVTGQQSGLPVRSLKNKMTRKFLSIEKETEDKMELELLTLGSLKKAVFEGDVDGGSLMSGQVAGQLTEIRPLKEIFKEMNDEYLDTLSFLSAEA